MLELEAKLSLEAGDPLMLTPYLNNGSIKLAQDLSLVTLTENIGFRSHAGFFTIDEKYGSNLYFWYFPPFSKKEKAPVVLWLQGGPGGSSLFGLFAELGPLIAKEAGFALRKYHWALNCHLVFIDSPVGTGFSFTHNDLGYCTDEKCIAIGLYNTMQQFYTLFPNLRSNDFYITGESYAGKYIPSLAMEVHKRNANGQEKRINLKGLAIGNGYCDPINQLDYGSYLYQHGLLDNNQRDVFKQYQDQIKQLIRRESWVRADLLMDKLIDGVVSNTSFFKMFTGFNSYYNFLYTDSEYDSKKLLNLLQNDKVRHSIHVGGLPFHDGQVVVMHLAYDMMKSVASDISTLLSHYKIVFYNGQLDIVVAYPLTVNFLRNLNFSSSKEYKTALRIIWRVGEDVAGYVKKAGNLTEVLVRNAGHMVPMDQPKWAFDLITRVVTDGF
ncbi:Carboxypeptidase [Operophtera brumata]|uniref:Carboxypeptidase n=1 Tax=Operophtera brumata TaxID=104452 RepID=A0A0L7LM73_OPEBR|nr:Carboxypeptidase [Operophtera brumata]